MEVRLRVEGDPVALSPGVDLAAYRIAQEGLTNAIRHAQATRADVLVRYSPDRLEVAVEDNGRGLPRSKFANGASPTGAATASSASANASRSTAAPSSWCRHPLVGCALAVSLPLKETTT